METSPKGENLINTGQIISMLGLQKPKKKIIYVHLVTDKGEILQSTLETTMHMF